MIIFFHFQGLMTKNFKKGNACGGIFETTSHLFKKSRTNFNYNQVKEGGLCEGIPPSLKWLDPTIRQNFK